MNESQLFNSIKVKNNFKKKDDEKSVSSDHSEKAHKSSVIKGINLEDLHSGQESIRLKCYNSIMFKAITP